MKKIEKQIKERIHKIKSLSPNIRANTEVNTLKWVLSLILGDDEEQFLKEFKNKKKS